MSHPQFENSDENSESDSEDGVYYNVSIPITPPSRPPNIDTSGPSPRPIPLPRKRSTNVGRDSSMPNYPALESPVLGRSRTNQNAYETHTLRNTIAARCDSPHRIDNGAMDGIKNCDWYWGDISRSDAEQKLKNCPDGYFLVRDSTTPGDYALTVRKAGQSKCLKVYQKQGSFGLKASDCRFSSVQELIEHYSHHSLAGFNKSLDVKLISSPSRKKAKKSENRYESLSALADIGRELQMAKQKYIELKKKQVECSNIFDFAQIQERAYMTANAMLSELLAPPISVRADDFVMEKELSSKEREILRENKKQAMERKRSMEREANNVRGYAEDRELEFNSTTISVNDHVEVLRDVEESCASLRTQLEEEGAHKELLECLVDECPESYPDRSLWLVDCSRDEAIVYLQKEAAGTFLIRPRGDERIPYALSIVSGNEDGSTVVKNCQIHRPAGRGYGFREDSAVFESLDELVCKHGKISIKVYFTNIDSCLDHPILGERPKSLGDLSDT